MSFITLKKCFFGFGDHHQSFILSQLLETSGLHHGQFDLTTYRWNGSTNSEC